MARNEAYREAEKKIKEVLLSGATSLDLSVKYGLKQPKLTEVPEALRQLIQLKDLDLSNNQLTIIPEWLGTLTQLQSLNLSWNKLTILPKSIGKLTQLKSLDLYHNELTIIPESAGELILLHSLNLAENKLTVLPKSIGQFKLLQELNLSKNPLLELPSWLRQLKQLKILDIAGDQLTAFPEWLGYIPSLQAMSLAYNNLTIIPESLGKLTFLRSLNLTDNQLLALPESLGNLRLLEFLRLSNNQLTALPESVLQLVLLRSLNLAHNKLKKLPESLGKLTQLCDLNASDNQLTDIPSSFAQFEYLTEIKFDNNPFSPELRVAFQQGLDAVKAYLGAKAVEQIILNEAKLILIGEGEVGKSCLLSALRGDPWEDGRPTTHGIEIKPVAVIDPGRNTEITLNGWDFGGQRVYRPTHQLFFSAPAVYLVVWKPREGPQQGFVKEWIKLVKHREPEAKILVVATHGGPQQRQPDIDRQELWDLFGKNTVIDFFFVDSKPDNNGVRKGIGELKRAIAHVAAGLPDVGRSFPKRWQDVRKVLEQSGMTYLSFEAVLAICYEHGMDEKEARLFVNIQHRLGHLIHYQHDPALRNIVVLKPDWLATAISFVLDDEFTRKNHGIVSFEHLGQLWNDPAREPEFRYTSDLHPLFLRLMERFDLSYKVAIPDEASDAIGFWQKIQENLTMKKTRVIDESKVLNLLHYTSLIAQLVPDIRPEKDLGRAWPLNIQTTGDNQQVQICRIVDERGQSATAEGLFYQLIVRLHKYSLGRINYNDSIHWQRGLVLDDEYNGRALLEHLGNDIRITVRAPYPERFLTMLTEEVKYLVESFWEGLRCQVMVPCIEPCGKHSPGTGLFEVEKLIDSKRKGRPEFPCPVCNEWQEIDYLLRNAPAAQPEASALIFAEFAEVKAEIEKARQQLSKKMDYQGNKIMGRFDRLDDRTRRILSQADKAYADLLRVFTDEAKEGPRLFSLVPVDRSEFDPHQWISAKFRLTLWCEHSKLPLNSPDLNGLNSSKGVYEIELTRDWFRKAKPYLKLLTGTLSLVLPVASSGIKLALDDTAYKAIEEELAFEKSVIDTAIGETAKIETTNGEIANISDFFGAMDKTRSQLGEEEPIRIDGATLRELHALLKAKDPGFGGLVRVMNKRQEFLWVHPSFEKEY